MIPITKDNISGFCKKHHIASLFLFGSVLTPQFAKTSDVDILVRFETEHVPNLFDFVDMEAELSAIVGRQVDLKTANDLSPYFRDEVLTTAKTIYDT